LNPPSKYSKFLKWDLVKPFKKVRRDKTGASGKGLSKKQLRPMIGMNRI